MKTRCFGLVVGFAIAAHASARIDLYLKEGGVSSYVFDGSPRNYLPYFDGAASAEIPFGQHITQSTPLDRTFFFWGRFMNEPIGEKILGVAPRITLSGNLVMGSNVIYRHSKTNGPASERWTRWDGSNPIPINGPAAAVTQKGIIDDGTNAWDLVEGHGAPDPPEEADFLLGAFHVASADAPRGVIAVALGPSGLVARDATHSYYPEVRVGGIIIQDPNEQVWPGVAYLTYVPEPAALWLLLALAGALPRRR
jgi:hypothetical protein